MRPIAAGEPVKATCVPPLCPLWSSWTAQYTKCLFKCIYWGAFPLPTPPALLAAAVPEAQLSRWGYALDKFGLNRQQLALGPVQASQFASCVYLWTLGRRCLDEEDGWEVHCSSKVQPKRLHFKMQDSSTFTMCLALPPIVSLQNSHPPWAEYQTTTNLWHRLKCCHSIEFRTIGHLSVPNSLISKKVNLSTCEPVNIWRDPKLSQGVRQVSFYNRTSKLKTKQQLLWTFCFCSRPSDFLRHAREV